MFRWLTLFRSISRREVLPRTVASLTSLLLATAFVAGCSDDTPTTPEVPTPVPIVSTFGLPEEPLSLNPNGARTHDFTVQQTGSVSATLTSLGGDEGLTVGLSLGTWNGQSCQIIIARDSIKATESVIGTANGTGLFCVRIYDVGNLTGNVTYSISVTHF
jgi:hypothetical protein